MASNLINTRGKSVGEQLMDTAIFMAVVGFIYMIVVMFFKLLAAPFKFLFMSDGQKLEAKIARAKEKVARREKFRAECAEDENDFMNQYVNRFQLYPNQYAGDPDNAKCEKWFEKLKRGKILDTELRWAPEVYTELDNGRIISGEFLDYFEKQVKLHSKGPAASAFLNTVRDMYPEFTPRFSTLLDETEELRERSRSGVMYSEIVSELSGKGVSEDLIEGLLEMNLGPEKFREAVLLARKCQEKGFGTNLCLYCIRNGVDVENPFISEAGDVFNSCLDVMGDEAIVTALIPKDRSDMEIEKSVRLLKEFKAILKEAGRYSDVGEKCSFISYKFRELMKRKCASKVSTWG